MIFFATRIWIHVSWSGSGFGQMKWIWIHVCWSGSGFGQMKWIHKTAFASSPLFLDNIHLELMNGGNEKVELFLSLSQLLFEHLLLIPKEGTNKLYFSSCLTKVWQKKTILVWQRKQYLEYLLYNLRKKKKKNHLLLSLWKICKLILNEKKKQWNLLS